MSYLWYHPPTQTDMWGTTVAHYMSRTEYLKDMPEKWDIPEFLVTGFGYSIYDGAVKNNHLDIMP